MSRSNPNEGVKNPSRRWFEWAGGSDGGVIRYYDKEKKENITLALPVVFILLDELATVRGWHDPSESGIYCNEVRDTRQDTFVVKAFKGGELASGLYATIRDRIKAVGGHFQSSCYVGFKDSASSPLELGNLSFKGAALNAWVEFKTANRVELFKQAFAITGYKDAKKGATAYRVPTFALRAISSETDQAAIALDQELQDYLSSYLKKSRDDQAATAAKEAPPPNQEPMPRASRAAVEEAMMEQATATAPEFDDDIPF